MRRFAKKSGFRRFTENRTKLILFYFVQLVDKIGKSGGEHIVYK